MYGFGLRPSIQIRTVYSRIFVYMTWLSDTLCCFLLGRGERNSQCKHGTPLLFALIQIRSGIDVQLYYGLNTQTHPPTDTQRYERTHIVTQSH